MWTEAVSGRWRMSRIDAVIRRRWGARASIFCATSQGEQRLTRHLIDQLRLSPRWARAHRTDN